MNRIKKKKKIKVRSSKRQKKPIFTWEKTKFMTLNAKYTINSTNINNRGKTKKKSP